MTGAGLCLSGAALFGCASAPGPAAPPVAPAVVPPPATTAPPVAPPQADVGPAPSEADAKARFAADMAQRGLNSADVLAILRSAHYSATVARLVLPATSPSVRSWPRYRTRFIEPRRIKEGVKFWQDHADTLARAEATYGVPASIMVSIIGVETFYGRVTGNFRIIDALSTLAFDYPSQTKTDRSAFFREQLAQFLVLCRENRLDPLAVKGSYAGAIGLPQFMPGSIRSFAVDGDGDGRIDLRGSADDAIMSVANFMVEHGWQRGQPVFVPVTLPADPSALVEGGLQPTLTWPQLRDAGAHATSPQSRDVPWQTWSLAVIDLFDGATGTTEYRVAAPNFFAITQYNHSYFYATSVADLAAELQRQRQQAN
jgi:membrane-bound lytic murein transglycosylase B